MSWPTRLRRLFKAGYFLICILGVVIVAYSATYGAFFQDDAPVTGDATTADALDGSQGPACVKRFKALHQLLKAQAHKTLDAPVKADDGQAWRTWAQGWRKDVKRAVRACQLTKDPSMRPLLEIAKDLKRLEVAYATAITGFRQSGYAPHQRLEAAFDSIESGSADRP